MSILDVIRRRRSTRKYKSDPIPEEVFLRVMEAARLAPSGKNLQPWHFVIVKDKDIKDKLAVASAHQYFIAEAPIIIVACADPENSYARMGRYMKS
ncbi:MAG: nitroreductase family protein, partial [Candidatus Aminicenantes bacterium]